MPGPVDRRSDAVDERTLHAVAVRKCAAQRRDHADGSGPQVRTRRRPRHWRHRHARHRGRRCRRRAATDLRQYAVLLPGDNKRNRKFSTAVAAKLPFRSGAGGSVPPERAGDGWRPSRVRQRGESRSDVADGWRDRRHDGGVVIDVASSEIVASGFSMPHSPRLYDGKLWLLNSGAGEFGVVDPVDGTFTPVCFCPGYARGLAFIGRYAVIGLSRPRRGQTFAGLALDDRLSEKDAVARCGMVIVDIDSGNHVEWVP